MYPSWWMHVCGIHGGRCCICWWQCCAYVHSVPILKGSRLVCLLRSSKLTGRPLVDKRCHCRACSVDTQHTSGPSREPRASPSFLSASHMIHMSLFYDEKIMIINISFHHSSHCSESGPLRTSSWIWPLIFQGWLLRLGKRSMNM